MISLTFTILKTGDLMISIFINGGKGRLGMNELREALYNISDSYYDFVYGVMEYASGSKERCAQILNYIKTNPHISSSEVVRYVTFEMDLMDEVSEESECLCAVAN